MKEFEKEFEKSQLGINCLHYEILRLSKEPQLTQALLKKLYQAFCERQKLLLDYFKHGGTVEDFGRLKEKMKNEKS